MKHKIIGALVCAVLFMFSSCGEDFLYKAPKGSVDNIALANETGVDLLVTAAYFQLIGPHWWGSGVFNWTFGGMYGGDANKGSDSNDQSVLNEMETYRITNTNGYLENKWNWLYRGSSRVNLALQVLNDAEMPDSKKNVLRGELLFLRAVYYFDAVKVFGPYLPFLDETIADNDPKAYNDKDIYPNILADVDAAISLLPNKPADVGRAYAWAAKMLKAKILMQQGKMAEAKPILADVLNNGRTASDKKYALTNDLTDNWNCSMDNTSPESIFEVQYSADGNNKGMPSLSLAYPHNSGPGGCCGFYQPSAELANSFQVDANGLPYLNGEYRTNGKLVSQLQAETGKVMLIADPTTRALTTNDANLAVDPRLDFAIGRINIPYKDYGAALNWVRDYTNGGIYLPKKHVYTQADADAGLGRSGMNGGWAPGSAMNLQYLSVRDAMLLYAECLANDGDLSGAMGYVNQIRARAKLPVNIIKQADGTPAANYQIELYPATHQAFTNKDVCIKAVRMERKLEMAMEHQRFFDLARWGGAYMSQAIADYLSYEKNHIGKFNNIPALSADKLYFPIPLSQIETMGKDENGQPYLTQHGPWK